MILYISEKIDNDSSSKEKSPLNLWKNCDSKNKLIDYVKKATKEGSSYFIPKEDRVAVFDFDGTLFQETDPIYMDYKLFKYRVLDDKNYINKATDEQKEIALKIKKIMETGIFPDGFDQRHSIENAKIFKDMTIEEVDKYTKEFVSEEADGYNNLKRGDAFYKPMLQVVEYLKKNDFIVYIVSGSDRFTVKSLVDGHIDIPKNNIIGSEAYIIARNQGDIDSFNYTFKTDDELVYNGEFIVKNLNMNKVYHIIREIGKRPVLSFGNSVGDSSMANYVISNKDHKGLAFMLLCDDTERENGDIEKANRMREICNNNTWIPVSMRDDWLTIYGDNVTKKNK